MEESYRILKPYLRGLPIIIIAMILGVIVAKKYLSYVTPMYESTAMMKLSEASQGVENNNLFKNFDVFSSTNKISTEIEVLKSQVLLEKVLNKAKLNVEIKRKGTLKSVDIYDKSPVIIEYSNWAPKYYDVPFLLQILDNQEYKINADGIQEVKGTFGIEQKLDWGNLNIKLNDSLISSFPALKIVDLYSFTIASNQNLIKNIVKNLDIISVDKDVPVIRISYKNSNPEKAAELVNNLAETYIEDYIETKYKSAKTTASFLDDQINKVVAKLTQAENSIQNYRDVKGITNIHQETETDLRKISQLKIQQTNMKMNLEAIQDLEQYIKKGKSKFLDLAPNFEAFNDLLSTEIVKKIKTLQAEKKDLQLVYTNEDNRVKVVDDKIEDLTSYLSESISNTRKNLESKYTNLTTDINEAQKVFIGVPEKEKMLTILDREFQLYQQSYNFLNEKRIEAEIAEAAKIAFHRILTPGMIAKEPISPNRTIITLIAAILGMFSAILFIYLVHIFKAKVNNLQTVETNSNIPVALLINRFNNQKDIDKLFNDSAIQLELKGLINGKNAVCISSFRAKEGAKFNALNLAKAFKNQGRKVVLVGVDNQLVNHPNPNELEILLLNDQSFTKYTRQMMNDVINELKEDYDNIIILNEPLMLSSKSNLYMSLSDLNLVVLDSRLSSVKRIEETELIRDEYKIPNLHFLLNRFNYNPNVIVEFFNFFRNGFKKLNKTPDAIA
ncbi:MAG: hypothetical protein IPL95_19215 [Saprospiraceae bacterium]|nr:hypothetical protein [Saprospiraceae bacterium]